MDLVFGSKMEIHIKVNTWTIRKMERENLYGEAEICMKVII